jgi:hypothetical protein
MMLTWSPSRVSSGPGTTMSLAENVLAMETAKQAGELTSHGCQQGIPRSVCRVAVTECWAGRNCMLSFTKVDASCAGATGQATLHSLVPERGGLYMGRFRLSRSAAVPEGPRSTMGRPLVVALPCKQLANVCVCHLLTLQPALFNKGCAAAKP